MRLTTAETLRPAPPSGGVAVNSMAKRSGDKRANAAFPHDVIDLFNNAFDPSFAGDQSREVRQVAFGLKVLHQLVDRELSKKSEVNRRSATALDEAAGILEALTTGHHHPIWKHISGLQTADFRPQNAPAVPVEQRRRAYVAGFVLAHQQAAKIRQSQAISYVIEALIFDNGDLRFTTEQVRSWVKRVPEANAVAQEFLAAAEAAEWGIDQSLVRRLRAVCRHAIWEAWSVPVVDRAPSRPH